MSILSLRGSAHTAVAISRRISTRILRVEIFLNFFGFLWFAY